MPSIRRIALLGASGSGKSWLAAQLAAAFAETGQAVQIQESAEFIAPAAGHLSGDVLNITHQRVSAPAATLLLGLDLHPASPEQLRADHALREALSQAGQPFQVIYGSGPQRLAHALQALTEDQLTAAHAADEAPQTPGTQAAQGSATAGDVAAEPKTRRKAWVWTCDKCSDPVCEHRLLSDLLAAR